MCAYVDARIHICAMMMIYSKTFLFFCIINSLFSMEVVLLVLDVEQTHVHTYVCTNTCTYFNEAYAYIHHQHDTNTPLPSMLWKLGPPECLTFREQLRVRTVIATYTEAFPLMIDSMEPFKGGLT